jgi:hypothetical protein
MTTEASAERGTRMNRYLSTLPTTVVAATRRRIASATLLLPCLVLLSGCLFDRSVRPALDLGLVLPPTWQIDTAYQLDTDLDQDAEWVICYTFDNLQNAAFVPIQCAIYDMARREPKLPVFYPYHLQAPGWTYLGEGTQKVSVSLQNVISASEVPGDPDSDADPYEVVVTNRAPSGFIDRVSIFRWYDNVPSELRNRTDPHEVLVLPNQAPAWGEWYECVGMFASGFKVELAFNQVTVTERLNDRSQLARIDVYTYDPGRGLEGYLDEAQELVPPTSSCIGFAHGIPADVAESPYPEKIVMAFLHTFNRDPGFGDNFLSADGKQSRRSGWIGQHFARTAQKVCVKLVSYGPPNEIKSEIRAFGQAQDQQITDLQVLSQDPTPTRVITDAPTISAQVETWHTTLGQPKVIKVQWKLARAKVDDANEGTSTVSQWKIDEACEVAE